VTTQPTEDVRVHMHRADLAPETGNRAVSGPESARPPARARAVSHLRVVDQGSAPVPDDDVLAAEEKGFGVGSMLLDELEAGRRATATAAEASDWASELMSPVEAAKQIAPRKGEASNWIIWSAMTFAGLARVLLVSLGYLVARGAETRIRAGAITGLLVTVIVISWLAGSAA
jgi:hypothetical protein